MVASSGGSTAWRVRVAGFVALVMVSAGCGVLRVDGNGPLDGEWLVERIVLDEVVLEPADGSIVLRIDTPDSALVGRTSCGQLFGSFTIVDGGVDGGRATFTVPTPPPVECSEAAQFEQDLLIGALEASSTWSGDVTGTIELSTTERSSVRIVRLP